MTQMTLWLGQWQFFAGLSFLLVCLALELGLAWVLLWFRLRTGHSVHTGWLHAYRFWARVFTLVQILAFSAGLLVLLQFAALWPGLAERAGDVLGLLVSWAVVSFFITRTAALGFMLFGEQRLSTRLHGLAVGAVAVGSTLTLFFLLSLLAWVQTPAGVHLFNTEFMVTNPWQVVFNPLLFPVIGLFAALSATLTSWLMLAVSATRASRQRKAAAHAVVWQTALPVALLGLLLHLLAIAGVFQHDRQHLPARAAATAGYWQSTPSPDLAVVGWPSARQQTNHFSWSWPGGGRWLLARDGDGNWVGLDQYTGMSPPVAVTFWSFRLMLLATGLLWLAACWLAVLSRRQRFDPAMLRLSQLRSVRFLAPAALLMAVASLAWMFLGMLPFAISHSVTFSEVMSDISLAEMLIGLVLHLGCLLALGIGFYLLLRHTVRYGVVPVARGRRLT